MAFDEGTDREDTELIRRMASRDAKALESFYDRYNRVAFGLVLRIVKVREDAEDVLVDVFWQVWQQAPRYDASRGKPVSWLLTIARARAIDSFRSASRHPSASSELQEGLPSEPTQPDPFVSFGARQAVLKCLEALSEQQRVPLEMAYFEGMSHTEIAS